MLVFLTKEERLNSRLAAFVYGELKARHIRQEDLAKSMGISQPALSKKLSKKKFSFEDFIGIVDFLKVGESDLKRLVGMGEE